MVSSQRHRSCCSSRSTIATALIKPGDYAEVHFPLPGAPRRDPRARHRADVPRRGHEGGDGGSPATMCGSRRSPSAATWATRVEVGAASSPADRIIDNPPDALREGDLVKIHDQRPNPANWRSPCIVSPRIRAASPCSAPRHPGLALQKAAADAANAAYDLSRGVQRRNS